MIVHRISQRRLLFRGNNEPFVDTLHYEI